MRVIISVIAIINHSARMMVSQEFGGARALDLERPAQTNLAGWDGKILCHNVSFVRWMNERKRKQLSIRDDRFLVRRTRLSQSASQPVSASRTINSARRLRGQLRRLV